MNLSDKDYELLEKMGVNSINSAAKALGRSRDTIKRRIKTDKRLAELVTRWEADEVVVSNEVWEDYEAEKLDSNLEAAVERVVNQRLLAWQKRLLENVRNTVDEVIDSKLDLYELTEKPPVKPETFEEMNIRLIRENNKLLTEGAELAHEQIKQERNEYHRQYEAKARKETEERNRKDKQKEDGRYDLPDLMSVKIHGLRFRKLDSAESATDVMKRLGLPIRRMGEITKEYRDRVLAEYPELSSLIL